MANKIEEILGTAASIAKGMGITFKEMMGPTVTDDYPDAPPKFEERFRGVHVLQRDVNGMEKCVACDSSLGISFGLPASISRTHSIIASAARSFDRAMMSSNVSCR